jgi:hypothetical protein
MIRLKQVLAVAQERNTRIGDDGDDRAALYVLFLPSLGSTGSKTHWFAAQLDLLRK